MLLKDIPKDASINFISAIHDLNPNIKAEITVEDRTLYNLGLSEEILCRVEINATQEEIDDLVEMVDDMEIDAFNYTDEMLENPYYAKQQKALEKVYNEHSIVEYYLSGRYF